MNPAKEEARQTILELAEYKKIGICTTLFILGCLPQRYKEELLREFPQVDGIVGSGEFYQIVNLLNQSQVQSQAPIIAIDKPTFLYDHTTPRHLATRPHTAYVKIAEGCDHGCTFCTVPKLRGRYRSRTIESIVKEVEDLTNRGVKEINLIAQDITNYGIDLYQGRALVLLLKKLVEIPKEYWLRLLYAYPTHFTDGLLNLIAQEDKICKYIDLPIQHIDDTILRSMNRKTTRQQIVALLKNLRMWIPNVTIRTSLIVGYPGETELQFKRLVNFVQTMKFDRLGVFPYSREQNTASYCFHPQVQEKVKQRRLKQIMELQQQIAFKKNEQLIGTQTTILIDAIVDKKQKMYLGRTEFHAPDIDGIVYVKNSSKRNIKPGDFVQTTIVAMKDYDLVAEVLP